MWSKIFAAVVVFTLVMGVESSWGFTKKVKDIDGGSDATGDAISSSGRFIPPSDVALRMAQSASAGVGAQAGRNYCYRGIKYIIADALGRNRQCVRSAMPAGSAKDAGPDLLKVGFVLDNSKCKTPGTIRVYRGAKMKGYRNDKGTIHGDVQVVGDDGMYHHFLAERQPSDERKPGRRILTGCYVPDANKISQGPLGQCPAVGYKTLKTKKRDGQSGVE